MKKLRIMLLSSIFALTACESNPYKLTASLPSPIIVADSDKDGVSDDKDRCPNTPLNVAVILENGCPIAPEVIIVNVINYKALFARNSYYPNHDNYYDKLGNIAKKLQENPKFCLSLEGHASKAENDPIGNDISKTRVLFIKQLLTEKYHINKDRIETVSYGDQRPIADNTTEEGRAMNQSVYGVIDTCPKESAQ